MIKFIYGFDLPDYLPPTAGFKELADILAIAGKYRVSRLEEQVRTKMATLPIAERLNGEGNALFSEKEYHAR